ncbi:MAG: hypothetical protein D6693_07075 [Planctomycetota bacterium]|nr:MAG: hypothetical protein D6693_07075 [Planctomycetota bacterium]
MIEFDRLVDLFARLLLVGGPLAAIILAFVSGETRREIVAFVIEGIALSLASWARLRWWWG